jgi:branched-chain amino acid transport system permease protein
VKGRVSLPHQAGLFLIALIVLALVPAFASTYLLTFILTLFMYVALAYSWNFISGYTGYISFGQIALFGIGSYGCAILISKWNMPWLLAAGAGSLLAGVFAIPLGLIMLRLKGPYFAVGMMGLFQFLAAVAATWKSLTNGATGIYLPPVSALAYIYFAFLGLAALLFLATWKLEHSVFGLRLRTVKEDEEGAESLGINTTFYKVFAFVVSALGCGFAGGIQVFYVSYVDPSTAFPAVLNITMIIMALLGGMGTYWGPVIGAVVLGQVSEFLWAHFPYFYLIIYGCLLAFIIMFMPSGIMGYFHKRKMLRGGGSPSLTDGPAALKPANENG